MIYLMAFVLLAFIVAMLPLIKGRKHPLMRGWAGMIALVKILWPIVLAGGIVWLVMSVFYRIALIMLSNLDVVMSDI